MVDGTVGDAAFGVQGETHASAAVTREALIITYLGRFHPPADGPTGPRPVNYIPVRSTFNRIAPFASLNPSGLRPTGSSASLRPCG